MSGRMATVKVPYLKLRAGRPRLEPGPKVRTEGFRGIDLRFTEALWERLPARAHELAARTTAATPSGRWRACGFVGEADGDWMDAADAVHAAQLLNEAVRDSRSRPSGPRELPKAKSVRGRAEAWMRSDAFPKNKNSAKSYRSAIRLFVDGDPEHGLIGAGEAPLAAVSRKAVKGFWRKVKATRGHAMANLVVGAVRSLFAWCIEEEFVKINPAVRLRIEAAPVRVRIYSFDEVKALIAAADETRYPEVGDGLAALLMTGQRPGDMLRFQLDDVLAGRIQSDVEKTGAIYAAPVSSLLTERARRAAARRSTMTKPDGALVVSAIGRRISVGQFNYRFQLVKAKAAETCPSVVDLQVRDARDTTITWLHKAGNDVKFIAAVTRHSLKSIHTILKHYLSLDEQDAAVAGERLETWMRAGGLDRL